MASIDTINKIKQVALELFNRDGYVNVRLQHISETTGLSLGNIGYHFRTKHDILYALFVDFVGEQKRLLAEFRVLPLFEDFNRFLVSNFEIQQRYVFFYKDTLELTRIYGNIRQQYRDHLQWQEYQLKEMLHFNEARGALKSGEEEDFSSKMASILVWASEGWIYRQTVTYSEEFERKQYLEMVWFLLKPYFTEVGKEEFENRVILFNT